MELDINLWAPMYLCHALIPTLKENSNASIVNVTSGLAFAPKKSAPGYCATKAGLHIFTKALRYQYEESKLSVFEVIPPIVATDMTEGRGSGKITPEQLVDEFISGYRKDKFEISIGKTKLLRLIKRISPTIGDRILKNG